MGIKSKRQLKADASNRSIRTFLQGIGIDIAVAIALVLGTTIVGWENWGDVQWAVLSFTVAKSVVQAVAAYVMRLWLDPSRLPTPLPPDPVPEPAE